MLPYQSVEEASMAMGRNLTCAEKLWFNFSANKSDFLLYSLIFLCLCLVFSFVPLPFALIELSRSKDMAKFKVQTKHQNSFSDMFKCYKEVMKHFFVVVGPLNIFSFPTIKWIGIQTGLPLPSLWTILAQLIVYFLIEDYTNYWLHRLLHSEWGYEKIHYMHHQYNAPFGYTAPYAHWAEILILGIPTFLGPIIVPCHIITLCLWITFRHMEAIQIHSGYEFPWNPTKFIPFYVGTEYHDYHHYVGRQSQCNFASVFTYCDSIYGTNKGYRLHKQAHSKVKGHVKKRHHGNGN